jgi:hypothetical protein
VTWLAALMGDGHDRGRRHVLDEPPGRAIAAGPAGRRCRRASELACPQLGDASRPSQGGVRTADMADAVHGDLFGSVLAQGGQSWATTSQRRRKTRGAAWGECHICWAHEAYAGAGDPDE